MSNDRSDAVTAELDFEQRVIEFGLDVPDFARDGYYGSRVGTMKAHHMVGSLLFLGGHVPELPDQSVLHPGRIGEDLTVEQGYEAARLAAINCLAGIRYAVGSLNRVKSIVRSLNFVVCTPDFHDLHLVSNGATDLFRDVFGEERGIGGRATVGVVSISHRKCFENWLTVEVDTP